MKKIFVFIILTISIIFCASCGTQEENIDIYASIYPVYYLTTNIVKDKLNVEQIYPNNADVHEYDPIADGEMKNLVKMNDAKLIFYIGGRLEAFIENAKISVFEHSISSGNLKLIELSKSMQLYDNVTEEYEIKEGNEHSLTADFHIWLDPIIMIDLARNIASEIVQIDPENTSYYMDNLNNLVNKLQQLDNAYKIALENFEYRNMLVDHDAYLYLAKRYNFTRIKSRVDNESCDVSPTRMIEVLEQAKKENIKYVVITKNEAVSPSVDIFKQELGAEAVTLDALATLTTINKDYYDVMLDNLEILKKIFR